MLDVSLIKKDFPVFKTNRNLLYCDSASTSLKPQMVIEGVVDYLSHYPANVHRGIYKIAEKATYKFEEARQKVANFINADSESEIIFTHNATEGINLVASSIFSNLHGDDFEIAITLMEHHANFVPWQQLALRNNVKLNVIPVLESFELALNLESYINKNTKVLALSAVSNVLGTINPVGKIIKKVRKINPQIIVVVDGCQLAPHDILDVKELDCDFLVFSGHKMLGPTGVGVLWGKKEILNQIPPYQFGGNMIKTVNTNNSTWNDLPYKFEAGTPPIAEVIGLGLAVNYVLDIGLHKIKAHETNLTNLFIRLLHQEFKEEVSIYTPSNAVVQSGIVSFNFHKIHAHDVAQLLADNEICIRSGHHCAMPLHDALGVSATNRVSFYLYNSEDDVERLITALKKVLTVFSKR
jgi:cysteine desulfurase/selenocysteine lyase